MPSAADIVSKLSASQQQRNELLAKDRRIDSLEFKLQDINQKYKQALRNIAEMEQQQEFLSLLEESRDPDVWQRELRNGKSRPTAIACASDWHCEERVDLKDTNGENRFNLNIAKKRIRRFFEKVVEYVERVPETKELILWLGGDMHTGIVHDDVIALLEPMEACEWWMVEANDGIAFIRKHLPNVDLFIVCNDGNHSRITKKQKAKRRAGHSLEWLTYRFMQREWAIRDKKIKWMICGSLHNIVNVQGRKIRFHHGDSVRFEGGTGGVHIPLRKAISQWNRQTNVDLDILGHWHTFIDGGHYIVNGSLIGYNAFANRIKADCQEPIQAFLYFDRKGLRQSTRIFVGDA